MSKPSSRHDLTKSIAAIRSVSPNQRHKVGDVFSVNLDEIEVREQVRQSFSEESLARLADAIGQDTQRQPVEVYAEGDRFVLISGERRYRAIKRLNQSRVEVKLREKPSDTETVYLQVSENEDREALTEMEIGLALKKLREFGEPMTDAAKRLGIQRVMAYRYLALADASPEVKALYDTHGVKDLLIFKLLNDIEAKWPESLREILPKVATGEMRRPEVEAWKNQLSKGKKDSAKAQDTPKSVSQDTGGTGSGETESVSSDTPAQGNEATERPDLEVLDADTPVAVAASAPAAVAGADSQTHAPASSPGDEGETTARQAHPSEVNHKGDYEHVEPKRMRVEVAAKLIDGAKVVGTLMLDRADSDSRWAWIQPLDEGQKPVRVEVKNMRVKALTGH